MKFLIIAALGATVVQIVAAQEPKISNDLKKTATGKTIDVIVQFSRPIDPTLHAKVAKRGGSLKKELRSIRAASYSMPAERLAELASEPEVMHISPDRKLRMLLDNSTAAVNASAAWNLGLDGSGIGIAVIDSGISNHDDLQGPSGFRVVYSQSFVDSDGTDGYGHGEHVSGILAGNGSDSNCSICTRHFVGLAPGANLIDLQALNALGEGTDSSVIAAIEEAIQLQSLYNIRVLNLSLGRPVYESYKLDPLCQAVEAAWQAGIVVVVAAGNDGRDNSAANQGYGTINAPGNDPYVITVGAMKTMHTPQRSDDLIASYSSKGPTQIDHIVKPDLVAPGNQVVSLQSPNGVLQLLYPLDLVPLNYYTVVDWSVTSPYYFTLSGTSMATPVVSGAAALLLQAQPQLTPDQVKARLMLSAYKSFPQTSTATDSVTGQTYVSEYDVFTVGAGYLDIQAALADQTAFSGTAMSPAAHAYPHHNKGYISCNANTVCVPASAGSAAYQVWGVQEVWGTQSLWPDNSIWTDQSVWDDQSIWSDLCLWSDQSIWTDSITIGVQTTVDAENVLINGEN